MHKVLIKTGMNVHFFYRSVGQTRKQRQKNVTDGARVLHCVSACVCVSAHGFHWVCATSLYWLCLRICVYVCVCDCVCVRVSWPVVQLRSTSWLPLLDPSVFRVTSKHLIISSSVIAIQTVLFLLLTYSICSLSFSPSYSLCLSLSSHSALSVISCWDSVG